MDGEGAFMALRKLVVALVLTASVVAVVVTGASANGKPATPDTSTSPSSGSTGSAPDIQVFQDAGMMAKSATVGGADVLPTTRTVPHWHGQAVNGHDGVTYGYNMVGADPSSCAQACTTHITTDVYPINVVVGSHAFNGTDVVQPTLASPQFTNN